MTQVKICGLTDPDLVRHAAQSGADWIGFVFAEASPRFVTEPAAASLLMQVGPARPVALLVDPDDAQIDRIVGLGFPILQLHGQETPDRVADIKARTGKEIWKAIGVAEADDLGRAGDYAAADRLLIDAKPPKGADRTGGHGLAFDWNLLSAWTAPRPWLLAGGLNPGNVADAIRLTGAPAIDVSSGVERRKGVKDRDLVSEFLGAAKHS
ncbi:phosphoribosylanthranilate isomerase [Hyphomonas sp.]|uniref:phosphoribosylanthranilate isomerase n=1 Tax=Hyphomonas sp. TaxID=87 RepID=UPI003518D0B2